MSGTSLDGVDAALLVTDGETVTWRGPALTLAYPDSLRERLRASLGGRGDVAGLERDLTLYHVDAVRMLLDSAGVKPAEVDVIGFHGHTILHRPQERRTWQIGDGGLLAYETGIAVVNDFRSNDIAVGGQGAPLVPIFHAGLAHDLERPLAILNLGGVGNVTWVGEDGGLMAFDTGPGNALIDDWALRHTGRPVDADGLLARAGTAEPHIVHRFASHRYFAQSPAKSLDRDDFRAFATGLVEDLPATDGAATLTAFTAIAVALACQHFPTAPCRWLVCGGGRRNPAIMAELRKYLDAPVDAVETVGWDGDSLEAQAFAYLAVRSLRGLPLTLPETTGAPRPITGGRLYQAR